MNLKKHFITFIMVNDETPIRGHIDMFSYICIGGGGISFIQWAIILKIDCTFMWYSVPQ